MKNMLFYTFIFIYSNVYSQEQSKGIILSESENYFVSLLNTYRSSKGIASVKKTDNLYQWSYDQCFYETELHKMNFYNGNFEYVGGHTQDIDIPNWEEQDRTDIPLKIRPLVRENVAVFWKKEIYPKLPIWNNQRSIAKEFLDAWIVSKGHRETLLDRDCQVISVCFYKSEVFIVKNKGIKYNMVIISATLNMGVF